MKLLLYFSLTTLILGSCFIGSERKPVNTALMDTSKSVRLDNYWIIPKETFEFNSFVTALDDTLHIVSCSDYVYFPFGNLTDKSSLKTSLLKDFRISSFKRDTFTNTMLPSDPSDDFMQWSESIDLELGADKLSLFLDNDPEASTHGYIHRGRIQDTRVLFVDSIKVGMSFKDFLSKSFDYFPEELLEKYSVIELESCVTDITHIYTFTKGNLSSVEFR